MHTKFWSEILKESGQMVDIGAHRRIILGRVLMKFEKKVWKKFMWLIMEFSGTKPSHSIEGKDF
jgi:hypothetical protein